MLELGVAVELCWPARGNQKGSVENLVGRVKGSFFKQRRFLDEDDLRQQLAEWHVDVQTRIPCRATGVTPAEQMVEERRRLRLLKVTPEALALRIPIWVGPTGMVLHDTHLSGGSVPAVAVTGYGVVEDRIRIPRWLSGALPKPVELVELGNPSSQLSLPQGSPASWQGSAITPT